MIQLNDKVFRVWPGGYHDFVKFSLQPDGSYINALPPAQSQLHFSATELGGHAGTLRGTIQGTTDEIVIQVFQSWYHQRILQLRGYYTLPGGSVRILQGLQLFSNNEGVPYTGLYRQAFPASNTISLFRRDIDPEFGTLPATSGVPTIFPNNDYWQLSKQALWSGDWPHCFG
jgi:hypothetical protein